MVASESYFQFRWVDKAMEWVWKSYQRSNIIKVRPLENLIQNIIFIYYKGKDPYYAARGF
ncbi:hypothetical protein D1631_18380 [Chryseobacterium nematophagum]|uniref:Uncharacterized protein n=1 Tax=Chryseobacterium nematophagum TaxID=2305228 RepID=A0A3M7TAY7_9FLAO|nr:hypothetical protein D1631_18380 [Chryseobacterium nematophagum]